MAASAITAIAGHGMGQVRKRRRQRYSRRDSYCFRKLAREIAGDTEEKYAMKISTFRFYNRTDDQR